MLPVCTAAQLRAMDQAITDQLGLPSVILMETASAAVAREVRDGFPGPASRGVVVVAGPGNNGGDGWGCARWLRSWGVPVAVWAPLGGPTRGDARIMAEAAARCGVRTVDDVSDAGLIVDALFGTGIDRPLIGAGRAAVVAMRDAGCPVVAVDLPSGVASDTGAVTSGHDARGPVAVRAAATVTFGRWKVGLLLGEGARLAGRVHVADLGLEAIGGPCVARLMSKERVAERWPTRAPWAHKGDSGRLLIVAGSPEMAGAAALAARGALAGGAGLVTVVSPLGLGARAAALPDAVMWGGTALPEPRGWDAVVVGPGLGGGRPVDPALASWVDALGAAGCPVVVDADALTIVGDQPAGPRVRTPHPGEAARRLGAPIADVLADPLGAARRLAAAGDTVLLKGWRTVVASGSELPTINPTGASTLATGGSGDVLAGLIGALLARGSSTDDAARAGAWVHGVAGERLAAVRAEGWSAGDVAAALPGAIDQVVYGRTA
jgi:NAD(P)H-hydrate epimerase